MRVTSPRRPRHKKLLARAKGYRMTRNRLYKVAHEAVRHAGQYAFAGRRLKRRDFRSLWIVRINAALRSLGVSYSKFMNGIKKAGIDLNRKMLSEMATNQPKAFESLVKKAGFKFTKE